MTCIATYIYAAALTKNVLGPSPKKLPCIPRPPQKKNIIVATSLKLPLTTMIKIWQILLLPAFNFVLCLHCSAQMKNVNPTF